MNDEIRNAEAVENGRAEGPGLTRRGLLKATAATAGAAAMAGAASLATSPVARTAYAAGSDEPIRVGFQVHRTGIGATYGRWYERTANAAAAWMNENGGIAGRPVELVPEDDGTDPKRGAEVVEKFASQHKVDFVYGPLFLACRDRLGAACRRAENPLFRGQRGLPRRFRQAQPLRVPAGDHRCARAGDGDGAVGDGPPRQARHDDVSPTMRSGTTTATTSAPRWRRAAGASRRRSRSRPPSLRTPGTSPGSRPTPRCSITSWSGRGC